MEQWHGSELVVKHNATMYWCSGKNICFAWKFCRNVVSEGRCSLILALDCIFVHFTIIFINHVQKGLGHFALTFSQNAHIITNKCIEMNIKVYKIIPHLLILADFSRMNTFLTLFYDQWLEVIHKISFQSFTFPNIHITMNSAYTPVTPTAIYTLLRILLT
jgi:hypothetical protein